MPSSKGRFRIGPGKPCMHAPSINLPMLAAGVLLSWLFVRIVRRGSIRFGGGAVERAGNPVGFWLVAGVNGLIVVVALLMGVGVVRT